MNLWKGIALLAIVTMLASPLVAHQQKEAITQVLFNQRTGNIEVMHRFLLHDVEHAVKKLRQGDADILGSEEDRQFFADYVHRHFGISDQDSRVLPLEPVGHEIEGRFLWVYSETTIPQTLSVLSVHHGALRDVWPEQINLVNVEYNGAVKSASFTRGSTEVTISVN